MGARIWISLVGAFAFAAATMVACSDDDPARAPFVEEPDAAQASLPDSGPPPIDGSVDSAKVDPRPPFDPKDEAVVCGDASPCAVQIVAGESHFCARLADGTARCWGDDSVGSLGVADAGDASVVAVTGLSNATQLSAGGTTTCALTGDGGVRCWGGNDTGQLGLKVAPPMSDFNAHPTPAAVALGSAASRVDVGQRTACALLTTGKTWCWGDNTQAELARTTTTLFAGPAEAPVGDASRTAAGTNTGFAMTTAGDILSWGAIAGPEGSIGARTASESPDPAALTILAGPATSIAVSSTTLFQDTTGGFPRPPPKGVAHACAVVKGNVMCWGVSLMGALATGLPEPAPKPTPAVVESDKGWPQQVAAAGDLTCVRLTDGSVQCAGDNTNGALARDPVLAPFSMFFEPATGFTGHAVAVAAAAHSVCALTSSGAVMCWGSNEHRELGLPRADTDPHFTALPIAF